MQFTPTPLDGAWLIDEERRGDSRGWFARTFCSAEFGQAGLETDFPQINRSRSHAAGTLRGMHYQRAPHAEVKVICCLRGALFDVIIDIRPESPTYRRWFGVSLTAEDGRWLYVPKGFAHGFITLEQETEAFYLISTPYAPHAEGGIRFDDPAIAIAWPRRPEIISNKDLAWPLLDPAAGA